MSNQSVSPAPSSDWLQSPVLTGRFITLTPLTEAHAADLQAGANDTTVKFLSRGGPRENTVPEWADYIARLNELPDRVNWAILRGGVALGRISFSETKPSDLWLEVGTMLLPAAQGTQVNPEAKLLLMTRAFEVLGANRVHFKVDARNERSRRAMQKLGAVEEGTLRMYQVRPDGFARDSVIFSVLRDEWPRVKAGLEARLAT